VLQGFDGYNGTMLDRATCCIYLLLTSLSLSLCVCAPLLQKHNFDKDQAGMHKQLQQLALILKYTDCEFWEYLNEKHCLELFFCFRWLLIMFKREFPLPDVQLIWEVCHGYQPSADTMVD
jgi:TBC1 domain family member 17